MRQACTWKHPASLWDGYMVWHGKFMACSVHFRYLQYCAKVVGTWKNKFHKEKMLKKKETFRNFKKCSINSSMQVKILLNHCLLRPLFTFKTTSIIFSTLSCNFIRKLAGRLFQTYRRTCHSSADFAVSLSSSSQANIETSFNQKMCQVFNVTLFNEMQKKSL